MSPTCAACLYPIIGRDSFVISGTEVVHKACARAGRQTELWRTREQLAEIRRAALSAISEARDTVRKATDRVEQSRRDVDAMRATVRTAEDRRRLAEARCADLENSRAATAQQRDRARQERDAVMARSMVSQSATPESTPDTTFNENDPMGIAARFALLELD